MTREELWLAAIAGLDGVNPPDYPVWHYEEMLAAIYDAVVGADSPRPFPERSWHLDEFLYAVYCVAAGLADPGCPEPTDRIELFWKGVYDGVKGEADASVPTPVWRIEEFLSAVFTASAGWGERTLTGSIVSFIGRANTEILALTAAITPVQDLHGYDNPWPAGGGVSKCPSFANGTHTMTNGLTVTIQDGEITIDGTASSVGVYEENIESTVMPDDAYVSFNNPVGTFNIAYVFIHGSTQIAAPSLSPANGTKQPTGLSGATVNKLKIFCNAGTYNNFKMSPIVHDGSTPQAWQPYANICPISGRTGANAYVSPTQDVADATTYPVTWQTEAGTVYGGTVDIVSGVLTVNMAFVDLGSLNWTLSAGGANIFTVTLSDRKYSADIKAMCSMYPFKGTIHQASDAPSNGDKTCCFYYQTGQPYRNFYVYDTAYSDVASFKTAMNGVQLCYELKTPVTYQLTPQTVAALVGQNYVWADTGDVTVTVKGAGVA